MISLMIDQLPITFLFSFTTCSQKPIWQTALRLCCSLLVPEDEAYPLSQHTQTLRVPRLCCLHATQTSKVHDVCIGWSLVGTAEPCGPVSTWEAQVWAGKLTSPYFISFLLLFGRR